MSYKIETFRVRQNNQGFLLGTFRMEILSRFIKFTERIVIDFDENNKPKYNEQVQRKISNSKVNGIVDFLTYDNDAFFPTNIVVSLPSVAIEELEEIGDNQVNIYLKDIVVSENQKPDGDIYLTIIDGQHRIAGIEKAILKIQEEIRSLEHLGRSSSSDKFEIELRAKNKLLRKLQNFEIIVSFFIDPTLEYQAMIFSTINRTQTKVSEDLVYSLFGLSKSDSPQKSALEIVLALNASEKSSLYNRMKLSGAKYKKDTVPPLSQSTMVKSILYLITPNLKQAEIEKTQSRDYVLRKNFEAFLPFRVYYGKNEDYKIIKIINVYFKSIGEVFTNHDKINYWDLNSPFNVLHTTVGYQALMLILNDILKRCSEDQRFDIEYYKNIMDPIHMIDFEDSEIPNKFPLTSKTISILYNEIGSRIFKKNFTPKEV